MASPNTPQFPNRAEAVTPSDAERFNVSNIYVGTTGDVAVQPVHSDSPVTFVGVPAGAVIPVRCVQVLSTGTTASDLVRVS